MEGEERGYGHSATVSDEQPESEEKEWDRATEACALVARSLSVAAMRDM